MAFNEVPKTCVRRVEFSLITKTGRGHSPAEILPFSAEKVVYNEGRKV